MSHSKKGATAAADLTDDLIIEILSRLPVKSVCRFKCVSWHWYHLISHPEHRKKLPQTISGFFYTECSYNNNQGDSQMFPNFEGISGDQEPQFPDPSLPFLTGYRTIFLDDCCNGLILCHCLKGYTRNGANHVVCNPAIEEWVVLPDSSEETISFGQRLGFDPDMSPHFHVFQILVADEVYRYITGVNIYSSETGLWSHKEIGWDGDEHLIFANPRGVFFNGMMHWLTSDIKILAVDTEGKTWRMISLLETMWVENNCYNAPPFIGHSQGRLYYINMRERNSSKLSVWLLEGSNSNEWTLKYSISTSRLFGELFQLKDTMLGRDYDLVAIHPECSLIFFIWVCNAILLSYDMDCGRVCVICSLEDRSCGVPLDPYLPYIPFYSQMGGA